MTTTPEPQIPSIAHRLVSARNYLYEATMSDYSAESIEGGLSRLKALKAEAVAQGYDPEQLVVWDSERGFMVAVAPPHTS